MQSFCWVHSLLAASPRRKTPIAQPQPSPAQPSEPVREDVKTPEPAEKTVPYSRFQEVIDQKNKLEEKVKELETAGSPLKDEEYLTDQEKELLRRQEATERELAEIKAERDFTKNLNAVMAQYPELRDLEVDFKEYISTRKGDIFDLAKAFLFEKRSERKGLEGPTGGLNEPPSTHYTIEEIKRIRETDEKLFAKLVREGRIDTKKLK